MLERNLSKSELTDLLTLNQQEIPSGVDKVKKSSPIVRSHKGEGAKESKDFVNIIKGCPLLFLRILSRSELSGAE